MATPIFKWAGGKRQLLEVLTNSLPKQFNRYYEPFLGAGALLLELAPGQAVVNDANGELINVYRQLQSNGKALIEELQQLQEGYNRLRTDHTRESFYLKHRTEFNTAISNQEHSPRSAALFIFLNRAGYNGLYRVNSHGLFNTPYGHREKIALYDQANLEAVSAILGKVKLKCGDFEDVCSGARKGDFVYFDPPYYGTYTDYQSGGFSEDDQLRLLNLFHKLSERGVYCMLSNSNHPYIRKLYKGYKLRSVAVKRYINSDASKRTGRELIIKNY